MIWEHGKCNLAIAVGITFLSARMAKTHAPWGLEQRHTATVSRPLIDSLGSAGTSIANDGFGADYGWANRYGSGHNVQRTGVLTVLSEF